MSPGRQLKLTVKEERIPENFQLQSALRAAALPFPSASVGAHTARGSYSFSVGLVYSQYPGIPSFFRRLNLQPALPKVALPFPSASADG